MILAEMWRKKMDPMNESDSTRTMNGSLVLGLDDEGGYKGRGYAHSEPG